MILVTGARSSIFSSAGDGAGAHIDARDIGAVAARALTGQGHDKFRP